MPWAMRPNRWPGGRPGSSSSATGMGKGFLLASPGGRPTAGPGPRVTKIDGSNHPALGAVAAGPGGYVALGVDGSRRAAWSSTDGRTWHRLATSGTVPQPARARMRYVNGQFLVPSGSQVWSSTDGRSWARARVPGMGNDVFDVAAGPGGGFVAVGRSSAGDQPGEVATADPALHRLDPAARGPRLQQRARDRHPPLAAGRPARRRRQQRVGREHLRRGPVDPRPAVGPITSAYGAEGCAGAPAFGIRAWEAPDP